MWWRLCGGHSSLAANTRLPLLFAQQGQLWGLLRRIEPQVLFKTVHCGSKLCGGGMAPHSKLHDQSNQYVRHARKGRCELSGSAGTVVGRRHPLERGVSAYVPEGGEGACVCFY